MKRTPSKTPPRWGLALSLLVAGCSGCLDRAKPAQTASAGPAASPGPSATPAPAAPERRVREPAVSGSWYPADATALARHLDQIIAKAPDVELTGRVIALVSPHAGYTFSGKAAAAGFKLLREQKPARVVVLAVPHRTPLEGASVPEVTHYRTPLGLIPVDQAAARRLRRCRSVRAVPEAHEREHSLEIQLPLLQRLVPGFELVPVLVGRMDEAGYTELAGALAEIVDARTVVVASSDFTHRGPSYSYELPDGEGTVKDRLRRLDQGAVDKILALDRAGFLGYKERTGATICGAGPIAALIELLGRARGVKGHVVSHYTSGDVTGDWTNTVTYVDIAFTGSWPPGSSLERARQAGARTFPLSRADKRALLELARRSLVAAVKQGSYAPEVLDETAIGPSLQRKAGAFVTLKCALGPGAVCKGKGEGLRGCIGTILPRQAVAETVARRAASAALEDRRFPHKVSPAELGRITVEVSVLTPPREVSGPDAIEIGRHGIILRRGMRSATYLPQVAPEQGWDLATTLSHLSRKAGLGPDGWRQGASFAVYEAIVFKEGEEL